MSKKDIGFCSCFPCGIDEGPSPCFSDQDCKNGLFCGFNNCPSTFDDNADCCTKDQLKSPNYPNDYPHNTEQTWLMTAPSGSIINLYFHSFIVRESCRSSAAYDLWLKADS